MTIGRYHDVWIAEVGSDSLKFFVGQSVVSPFGLSYVVALDHRRGMLLCGRYVRPGLRQRLRDAWEALK